MTAGKGEAMTVRKKQVLVVDNNEDEGQILSSMLKEAGYETMTTWSGLEALDLLKKRFFDLVLVSEYLADLYIGDFLKRLDLLPTRPCSMVIGASQSSEARLQRVKSIIEENTSVLN